MQKKLEELVEKTGVWPLAAGAGLAFIAGTAWYVGVFKKVAISEKSFEGGTFIYASYQGSVRSIYKGFKPVFEALAQFRKDFKDVAPKDVPITGIYYDNPNELQDQNQFRADIGFLLEQGKFSEDAIKATVEYFTKNEGIKIKLLPSAQSVHGTFPFRCALPSYALGASKFYPAMETYMTAKKEKFDPIFSGIESPGAIEINRDGQIQYFVPFENVREFSLTEYAKPAKKQ
ncbi:hypothetical protein FGO68_gene15487 [Halteria grandinella]|uniref:GyrI-like small molecule binding domain-containing protein n=1 Tax=Halteria grandinella TaxID=5974 RepID=A0A8J8NIW4_HALGN|nr:hypothetical protein FGO68_gene15487 [Halteria grandinella]